MNTQKKPSQQGSWSLKESYLFIAVILIIAALGDSIFNLF